MLNYDGKNRRLRIAMVAPLHVRVPPARYGGTERVVSELTDELVSRGHDVTLFAAGTSATTARLRAVAPRPLWDLETFQHKPYEVVQVEEVARSAPAFDVIHWHLDYIHLLVLGRIRTPSVTTLHGRLDDPSIRMLFAAHPSLPVVSISNSQRRPLADLAPNWVATVHHGLDFQHSYRLGAGDGGYLAFVGRSSAEKGLAIAIHVAIRTGIPIKIGARVGASGVRYHNSNVLPLLRHPLVEWLGEITDEEKASLLERAIALLMPIDWEEPFGLSFIESLAAGTPIITRPKGALPELMRDGVHGFFADTEDAMVAACSRIGTIDRTECRRWALEHFSTARMADDYESVYRRVMSAAVADDRSLPTSA
jgi:glycosyltransferase involved in cell wall biosynthesis